VPVTAEKMPRTTGRDPGQELLADLHVDESAIEERHTPRNFPPHQSSVSGLQSPVSRLQSSVFSLQSPISSRQPPAARIRTSRSRLRYAAGFASERSNEPSGLRRVEGARPRRGTGGGVDRIVRR
jgi:hypothetical protein